MTSSRCRNPLYSSAVPAQLGPEQASAIPANLPTLRPKAISDPPLASEPIALADLPALEPKAPTGPPPASEPAASADQTATLGPVSTPVSLPALGPDPILAAIYTGNELQRLLKICIGAKKPSSNESCSILKARFLDLYSGKSYLNYYQFCQ